MAAVGLLRQRRTMFSSNLCPSINTLISLLMLGCLLDSALGSLPADKPEQCHNDDVCKNIGSSTDHRKALIEAFSENHAIDLIFVICNTSESESNCANDYADVRSFIVNLVTLVSTIYGSYIDADRLHISIIVYDRASPRVILNDIEHSTPTVGNCEFETFLNDSETKSTPGVGLMTESLKKANEILGRSSRKAARKIMWLFSDCRCCNAYKYGCDSSQNFKNAVGDIINGYKDNVFLFTVGVGLCPGGFFDTFPQEDTMKALASTNTSHYACVKAWNEFVNYEKNSGNISQYWTDISDDTNTDGYCRECVNSKSSSTYRCACKVTSKLYECHEFAPSSLDASTLAIALGAGIGGGLLVVIIIVIIVVTARRCKGPRSPPPPPVRTRRQRPPSMVPTSDERTYGNTKEDDDVEYEVLELERSMPGWSAHLSQLKREHPVFLHLGVYSLNGDYYAQTPGFSLIESQRTALEESMTKGNSCRNLCRKSDVTVNGTKYRIEKKTRKKLSARASNNRTRLLVVLREEYLVVGVVEGRGGRRCDEVIEEIMTAVTMPLPTYA